MAFSFSGYSRVSVGVNEPIVTLADNTVVGSPQHHTYQSGADTLEAIIAPNYFLPGANSLFKLGDIIHIDSIAHGLAYRVKGSYYVDSVTTSPTGVPTGITVSSYGLSVASLTLTSANWLAMTATPVSILAAPGANNLYLVDRVVYDMQWPAAGGQQYQNGSPVLLQYDAAAGGVAATATVPAAAFIGAVNRVGAAIGASLTGSDRDALANKGLYISTTGAAFTNGNSPVKATLFFETVRLG